MSRRHSSVATSIAVSILLIGCASSAYEPLTPSASVTTTSPAAERIFRVEWTVEPRGPNATRLEGYVHNTYGRSAERVQVLAQALDTSGNLIDQKLVWIPGTVPQFGRSYFTVDKLPPAPQYRVTVWAFELIDPPSRRWP